MSKTELQRKITVKGCGWGKDEIMAVLTKAPAEVVEGKITKPAEYHSSVDLVKVVGVVGAAKPGSTEVGDKISEYLKLIGDFTAVNLSSGEMFRAPTCILSDVVSGPIKAALDAGADEVQFAVMISAKYDSKAATGYVFSTKPLLEVKPTDKMTALLEAAGVSSAPRLENNPTDPQGGESAPDAGDAKEPAKPAGKPAKK